MNNTKNLVNLFNEAVSTKNAEIFITAVQPIVLDYARRFCTNPSDFEDICQDVYLNLCEEIAKGKKVEPSRASFFNLIIMRATETAANKFGAHDDLSLSDIHNECDFSFDKTAENIMDKDTIRKIFSLLTKEERDILSYKYGLNGNIPRTKKETSTYFGVSQSHVATVEKHVLKKLSSIKNRSLIKGCI